MLEPAGNPYDVWSKATPLQLIQLMRLLGVEQRIIAERIGATPSAVSMWVTGQRPIPQKYRPSLLQAAAVAWQEAFTRHHNEVTTLPTDALKVAAMEAFHAPLTRWSLQVLHEAGIVRQRFNRNLELLCEYRSKEPLTPGDHRSIRALCTTILRQSETLEALEDPQPELETQLVGDKD